MRNRNRFESTNVRYGTHSTNEDGDGDDNDENFDNKHVIMLYYDLNFQFPLKIRKYLYSFKYKNLNLVGL